MGEILCIILGISRFDIQGRSLQRLPSEGSMVIPKVLERKEEKGRRGEKERGG